MEFPFIKSGFPMTAASATAWMGNKRALDLSGPDIVAGDNDDVIRPAEDHDIAVFSFDRKVADGIDPVNGIPVFPVAFVILARPSGAWRAMVI